MLGNFAHPPGWCQSASSWFGSCFSFVGISEDEATLLLRHCAYDVAVFNEAQLGAVVLQIDDSTWQLLLYKGVMIDFPF